MSHGPLLAPFLHLFFLLLLPSPPRLTMTYYRKFPDTFSVLPLKEQVLLRDMLGPELSLDVDRKMSQLMPPHDDIGLFHQMDVIIWCVWGRCLDQRALTQRSFFPVNTGPRLFDLCGFETLIAMAASLGDFSTFSTGIPFRNSRKTLPSGLVRSRRVLLRSSLTGCWLVAYHDTFGALTSAIHRKLHT